MFMNCCSVSGIRRRFDGQVFCAYLLSYGVLRFCVEFVRGDASRGFVLDGLFSTSQAISLVLICVALVSYRVLSQRVKGAAH